ncbi:MAG: SpoIIE family protein phosphatase [Candidatus Thiodiazotropha sp. (ex Epidulcina cf. delphinae)]|nr:SpoIIE family protein phosphatase [Candidatus Thiodiazotropha sp. (ex Epidulcina cf. delphinae)]
MDSNLGKNMDTPNIWWTKSSAFLDGGFWLFFFLLILSGWAFAASTDRKNSSYEKNNILLLNSYNKGYGWTDNQVEGVENIFPVHGDAVLHTEYMSTKLINKPEYYKMLRDLYKFKYRGIKFDAIISTDDNAMLFLRKYRNELFPEVPVIFSGINNFNPSKVTGFKLFTGVNEETDYKGNIELILKLHPNISKLYAINDQLTTGKIQRKQFEKLELEYRGRLKFEYLDNYNLADLKKKLAVLEKDSVLFFLSFFKDATGKSYVPQSVIPEITASSVAPVYGSSDYMLDYGMVGGLMKSSYYQGEMAGKLSRRVLDGENVSDIPIILEGPNRYIFDYLQLKKFGISISDLPENSMIMNEPETFYYRYKKIIWTTIVVFTLLLIYILILLLNINKRKRAQAGLQAIIEASAHYLDFSSLEGYKQSLINQMKTLMPLKNELFFYKQTGEKDGQISFDPVATANVSGGNGDGKITKDGQALLREAADEQQSVVFKEAAVAFFKNKELPGNLIYFQGCRNLDDLDRDLLEIYASNVSMSQENQERHKLEETLETARKIQMNMLPNDFNNFSKNNNVDLHAFVIPAKAVGGDLYDFFQVDEDHICITVGDVSDKGIPSALFMVMAKTLLRAMTDKDSQPHEILFKVNNELSRDNEQAMFVTLFTAILNIKTGEMVYANAGHNPPYVVKQNGEVEEIIPQPRMVLGAFKGSEYVTEKLQLEKGEGFLIFSDGITEAKNTSHAMYGEQRLESFLSGCATIPSKEVTEKIFTDVKGFTKTEPQSDDITMLFVRRNIN